MEIIIDRKWKKDTYTIGKCYINGTVFSDTLEDKDRGLNQEMTIGDITSRKIYGETAIPTGTYNIQMTYSNKFSSRAWAKKYSGKVIQIMNVKGFEGVRIHPLNMASESLGCIGVGKNNVKGKITNATDYYYKLVDNYILPALKKGENVTLVIK